MLCFLKPNDLTNTQTHTREFDEMEETIKEQINRVQALTENQKDRFLRIYFHGCQHVAIDATMQTIDPE